MFAPLVFKWKTCFKKSGKIKKKVFHPQQLEPHPAELLLWAMAFGFIDSSGPGTAPSAGFSQWRDKAVQQALHCMSHTGASVPSAAAWKHYCLQCCTEIFIYLFGGLWPCALVLLSDLLLGIRFSTHWIPSWTWTPSNLWQVRGHTKFHMNIIL